MKTSEVRRTIREHRGDVYVGVLVRDDVIYVKAVKSDLLKQLEKVADHAVVTSRNTDGMLFLDNETENVEDCT